MSASKIIEALQWQRGRDGLKLPEAAIPSLAEQIRRHFPGDDGVAAALVSIDMQKLVVPADVEATIGRIIEVNSPRPQKPYWHGDGWDPGWVRRDPRWFGRAAKWYVPIGGGLWLAIGSLRSGPLRFSGDAEKVQTITLEMRCMPNDFASTLQKFRQEVRVAGWLIWPDSNSDAAALVKACRGQMDFTQEMRGRKVVVRITAAASGHVREPPEHHFTLTATCASVPSVGCG